MIKHYCDRCGVECEGRDLAIIKIPTKRTKTGFETEPLDVCPTCEKEYMQIIDTLTDIRFIMFDKFFTMKGE